MRAGLFSLACLFLTISCSRKPSSQVDRERELDSYFQGQFPSDEPGGAVLVAQGDSILFEKGYGLSDLKTKEPITPQTLFNLGSISKTFVSNAILILQEQGRLSVEDSLWKYFRNFRNKKIAQKVKIKHLLTHTSGLPDNRQVKKDSVFYLTAKDAENWYPVTQTDTLLFEPGSRYEYSNPAFNGLALIVEQVSGMKWQQFIARNIFRPSGMVHSTITDGPQPESGVSHGYSRIDGQWKEDDYGEEPTFPAAGNGGVWSSVEELVRYEQALRQAKFLNAGSVRASRTVFRPVNWLDTIPPKVGWSWFIGKTEDGLTTIGHSGDQGGFLCNYVVIPDRRIQVVILCNTPRDIRAFTRQIMEAIRCAGYFARR